MVIISYGLGFPKMVLLLWISKSVPQMIHVGVPRDHIIQVAGPAAIALSPDGFLSVSHYLLLLQDSTSPIPPERATAQSSTPLMRACRRGE